jgi:cysteine desulfuration protein SufE
MSKLQTIIDDFEYLDDWEDRYRYVIEIGKALPEMPASEQTDANKVKGCASQVWLVADTEPGDPGDPVMIYRGDSDAHIVRGLVAIVLAATSGEKASAVEEARRRRSSCRGWDWASICRRSAPTD